jgi:hypothetical protein
MADSLPPPDIQESARVVRAWETTAKPGDLPPLDVHAHALKIQGHLRAQSNAQPQRVESAADKFKRLPRSDTPAPAEPWRDPRLQLPEQRWRNPRGAA